jgi:cytochrome c6
MKFAVLEREHEMKKIISLLILLTTIFTFAFSSPALAADIVNGGKIFAANCAACHVGGKNVIVPVKGLRESDLRKYAMDSQEAIIRQVTKGKNAMPAFSGRLKPEQIADVAAYVLAQAEKGW